jgi:hypothetical protein
MARGLLLVQTERMVELFSEKLPDMTVSTVMPSGSWQLVIRLADVGTDDASDVVLNRASAVTGSQDKVKVKDHWSASRIRHLSAGKSLRFYRRYRVHVFDSKPIYMQRAEIGRRRAYSVRWTASKETREVAQLALAALYAVGLDLGTADIGLSSKGNLYCLHVDACPALGKRLVTVYAEEIKKWTIRQEAWLSRSWIAELRGSSCPRFLMGADPEFMMRDSRNGRMAFASDFFPMQGLVGCDARRVRVGRSGYPLAEVRPKPAQSPLELAENIRVAMLRAARLAPYRNVQWRAGTLPFRQLPVGGHIHFSLPPQSPLLRALDNYLAVVFLLLENPAAARARRQKYGWLGDHRTKPHGGFEYRVTPSWLVSPQYTKAALCLAKVIACEWPRLRYDYFSDPAAQRAFRNADHEYFRPGLSQIIADLRQCASFPEYREEIEPVFEQVLAGQRWRTGGDLRRVWHLPVSRRVRRY